ncbi:MAG: IS110 family transposase [Planctomycetota bacterium]
MATKRKRKARRRQFPTVNANAAGVDIGSREIWGSVPEGRDTPRTRKFQAYTGDLYNLANWLLACRVQTVAMESTGVYWIPLYNILEERGLEVLLTNARDVKNVSGRKTDVLDCEWIQQLHTFGLLRPSFRPELSIRVLRTYSRQRETLIRAASDHVNRMQKTLAEMNLLLQNVISDITGLTGRKILQAILDGERSPVALAQLKHPRIRSTKAEIARALEGDYREELLFVLGQELAAYDFLQQQIAACDAAICQQLQTLRVPWDDPLPELSKHRSRKKHGTNAPPDETREWLYQILGVDITAVPAIGPTVGLVWIAEAGSDMTPWKSEKHFGAWLNLAPNPRITGGRRLRSPPKKNKNRLAHILKIAAQSLYRSNTALGANFRRLRARLGPQRAIKAMAYKLAKILYLMIRNGTPFREIGGEDYEQRFQNRTLKNLKRRAKDLGFQLVPIQQDTAKLAEDVS